MKTIVIAVCSITLIPLCGSLYGIEDENSIALIPLGDPSKGRIERSVKVLEKRCKDFGIHNLQFSIEREKETKRYVVLVIRPLDAIDEDTKKSIGLLSFLKGIVAWKLLYTTQEAGLIINPSQQPAGEMKSPTGTEWVRIFNYYGIQSSILSKDPSTTSRFILVRSKSNITSNDIEVIGQFEAGKQFKLYLQSKADLQSKLAKIEGVSRLYFLIDDLISIEFFPGSPFTVVEGLPYQVLYLTINNPMNVKFLLKDVYEQREKFARLYVERGAEIVENERNPTDALKCFKKVILDYHDTDYYRENYKEINRTIREILD